MLQQAYWALNLYRTWLSLREIPRKITMEISIGAHKPSRCLSSNFTSLASGFLLLTTKTSTLSFNWRTQLIALSCGSQNPWESFTDSRLTLARFALCLLSALHTLRTSFNASLSVSSGLRASFIEVVCSWL